MCLKFAPYELPVERNLEGSRLAQARLNIVSDYKYQEAVHPWGLLKLPDKFWSRDPDSAKNSVSSNQQRKQHHLNHAYHTSQLLLFGRDQVVLTGYEERFTRVLFQDLADLHEGTLVSSPNTVLEAQVGPLIGRAINRTGVLRLCKCLRIDESRLRSLVERCGGGSGTVVF